jgi:signal recognition particle subunit SRP54
MEDMMAQLPKEALDDYELVKVESMIQSMTAQERRLPDLLDESRMRRIARGSGRTQQEVRDLVARFKMTRTMMKDMGGLMGMMGNPAAMQRKLAQLGGGRMPGMPGMPGMMGGTPGAARAVSKEEMDLRRKKAKDARKARKKQRR